MWLTVFEDDQDPQSTMLEWRSPVVRNTQPGDYVATRPHHKIAYVPESLLATVRREEREAAFKEAIKAIDTMNMVVTRFQPKAADTNGWFSAIIQAKKAIAALEAAAAERETNG